MKPTSCSSAWQTSSCLRTSRYFSRRSESFTSPHDWSEEWESNPLLGRGNRPVAARRASLRNLSFIRGAAQRRSVARYPRPAAHAMRNRTPASSHFVCDLSDAGILAPITLNGRRAEFLPLSIPAILLRMQQLVQGRTVIGRCVRDGQEKTAPNACGSVGKQKISISHQEGKAHAAETVDDDREALVRRAIGIASPQGKSEAPGRCRRSTDSHYRSTGA